MKSCAWATGPAITVDICYRKNTGDGEWQGFHCILVHLFIFAWVVKHTDFLQPNPRYTNQFLRKHLKNIVLFDLLQSLNPVHDNPIHNHCSYLQPEKKWFLQKWPKNRKHHKNQICILSNLLHDKPFRRFSFSR